MLSPSNESTGEACFSAGNLPGKFPPLLFEERHLEIQIKILLKNAFLVPFLLKSVYSISVC